MKLLADPDERILKACSRPWSLNGIDLVTLRLFMAAAEEGNLARAAEREHIAISAVSRRISDLEARCGVALLERHDRGVNTTAAGAVLVGQIRGVIDLLQRMILEMEAVRGGARGRVRIHAHMSAICGLLPKKIAEFLDLHPGIDIELDEFTSLEVLHSVRTGSADLGLVSGTVKADDLHLAPWAEDRLVAILPNHHQLLDKATLTLEDMLDEPFIGMQHDSALLTLYRDQAGVLGRKLLERAHTTSFESVRKMVSVGLGVAILPAMSAYPLADDEELGIAVRPLAESWARRPLMLCIKNVQQLSAATRLLISHLRSADAERRDNRN